MSISRSIDAQTAGGATGPSGVPPGQELVSRPVPLAEFFALGERLTNQEGLRLIDFEIELVNGERLFSGLWRTGTGTNLFVNPRRIAASTKYLLHICEEEGQNDPKCIVGEEFDQVSPC